MRFLFFSQGDKQQLVQDAYANKEIILAKAQEYIDELTQEPAIVPFARKMIQKFGDFENVSLSNRGSGVKRIVYLYYNILQSRLNYGKRNIVFAIDEPEMSLHPSQQRDLMKALKEISEYNQVILTTHSPVIVKEMGNAIDEVRILISDGDASSISCKRLSEQDRTKRLITTYPSLNEINYIAFDEWSVEYHIDLFGYLHDRLQHNACVGDRISDVDDWLEGKNAPGLSDIIGFLEGGIIKKKSNCWVNTKDGTPHNRTLPYCVRNNIDHPAPNTTNKQYDEMVQKSIEILRAVIIANPTIFN